MKTKKVEKVITTLKDRIGHPLKRHFTEIPTQVNNFEHQKPLYVRIFTLPLIFGFALESC